MAVLVAAALGVAGCGATPPQAPLGQAKKLDASLGGMSASCGLAYQVSAFAAPGTADLGAYETTATMQAAKLASVYRSDPGWIYQGETVRKIVGDSIEMLDSCGLARAAAALKDQTAR